MLGLTTATTIHLTLTADQWELYDLPGRDTVAVKLHAAIETILNDPTLAADEKMKRANRALADFSDFGAADSEGFHMLEAILEAVSLKT